MTDLNIERTFIMVKPDGVQRGLIGEVIKRFEARGFKLVAIKFIWPGKDLVKEHYGVASAREFYPTLSKFMTSGPVVATVWEGSNAVQAGRRLIGARDAIESSPGSIRGSFSLYHHNHHRNIIHGSDCIEEANREIALWFSEEELVSWTSAIDSWANEQQS